MNESEKIVIEILKEVFNGNAANIPLSINSDEVCKELTEQAVYALSFNWLKNHNCLNREDYKKDFKNVLAQTADWFLVIDEQQNLVETLRVEGYPFAVMKGNANAVLYPIPELRRSGDIDILVRKEDYDAIRGLLLQNGYVLKGEIDPGKHHYEMIKNGVLVEVHWRPGGISREKTEKNTMLIDLFQAGLNSTEWVTLYDYTFPVLPRLQNGIMLLLHIAQHLTSTGIGLRHLLDWMVYADNCLSDEYWNLSFKEAAESAGVYYLAKVLTRSCQLYLGLNTELHWCKDIDQEICTLTIEYFVQQGEFGGKQKDKTFKILTESRTLIGFLKYFDRSSTFNMPLASEIVLLRPIAWIYQIVRYIIHMLKVFIEGDSISEIHKAVTVGVSKRELLEKLKIRIYR